MGTGLPTSTPSRRWIGRLVRIGLVFAAVMFAALWIGRKVSHRVPNVRMQRAEVTDQALAPGDLRVYNIDSTVDLVLVGDRVLAGLSPKTTEKVRADIQKSTDKDTTGFGGLIAASVKQTVANAIGTHIVYPVRDIEDMRYEDGQIIIERTDGGTTRLFGDAKVNGEKASKTFPPEVAQRFIDAVLARKRELDRRGR